MISLGSFVFPEKRTFVKVRTREVLSRVRKEIEIHSLLIGYSTLEQLQAVLEALEGELEKFDRQQVSISLQAGRFYLGRRRDVQRFVEPAHRAASVYVQLLTEDRFERSIEVHQQSIQLTESGQTLVVVQAGNGWAYPAFVLSAAGTLVRPRLSDGARSLVYQGTLSAGEWLELDSDARSAGKNGAANVLHDLVGEFPLLNPGSTVLTFSDDPGSSHSGTLQVNYRDLWV